VSQYGWSSVIRRALLSSIVVVGLVACSAGDDGTDTAASDGAVTSESDPPGGTEEPLSTAPTSDVPATQAPADTAATVGTDPPDEEDVVDGAPEGAAGDSSNPVPAGQIANIGDGYRMQVLSVVNDATQAVLAEDPSNQPPPEGSQFTLVEVAVGYYGIDDPQFSGFATSIQAVGSSEADLPTDCGVVPGALESYYDMFGGGVIRGNLCFVSTPADTEQLQVYPMSGSFNGVQYFEDEVHLDASASPGEVAVLPTLSGVQPGTTNAEARLQPTPLTEPAEPTRGWSVTVTGPAADITDAVLAEDPSNSPPPEGFRYVGIPIRWANIGDAPEAVINTNVGAVGDSNVAYSFECGVTPEEQLDLVTTDVPAGGSVDVRLCLVVPVGDRGSELFYAFENLADYTFFATT